MDEIEFEDSRSLFSACHSYMSSHENDQSGVSNFEVHKIKVKFSLDDVDKSECEGSNPATASRCARRPLDHAPIQWKCFSNLASICWRANLSFLPRARIVTLLIEL